MTPEYPDSMDTWGIPFWLLAILLIPAIIGLAALIVWVEEWWNH